MSPEQDPFDKILGAQRAEAERERVAAVDLERRNGLRYQAIKERGRALAEMLKPTLDKSVSALQATRLPELNELWGYDIIDRELFSATIEARAHRFRTARRKVAVPLKGDSGLEGIIAISYTKGLISDDERIEPVGWQVAKGPSEKFVSTVQKEFSPEFPIKEEGDGSYARFGGDYNLLAPGIRWAKLEIPARGTAHVELTERAEGHSITEYPGFIEHTEYTPAYSGPHISTSERYENHSEGRASLYAGAIEAITSYLANK